jgi:hypothetical protein
LLARFAAAATGQRQKPIARFAISSKQKNKPTTKTMSNHLKSAARNGLLSLAIFALTGAGVIIPHFIPETADHPNAFLGSFLIGLFGLTITAYAAHRALDCVVAYYDERERQRRIKQRWTEQRL